MINKAVTLLIAVFLLALAAFGINYFMEKFHVAEIWQNLVWAVFGLLILLGIFGLFGYGPFAGTMKEG